MYKLLLCQRYLRTRYIALASVISVTLGVATMIVVNSVMAGFSTQMRERIHGILADVVLESNTMDGVEIPTDRLLAICREAAGDDIEAMSPTVEIYGMLHIKYLGQYITRPIQIIGIDPKSKAQVGTLKEHLENFQAEYDKDGKLVRAAAKPLSADADWELLPEFQEHRRLKSLDFTLDTEPRVEAEETRPAESAELVESEAPAASEAERNPFTEPALADNAPLTEEERSAPLPARVYLGAGLIRFPYKDPAGETRMVSMVLAGDDVSISTATAGRPPKAIHFDATVVDIFKSGMSEYDSNLVFMNLEELQDNRGMIDPQTGTAAITTIQIKLKDWSKAKAVVEKLRAAFPPGMFSIRTWEQKQGPLLAAVSVETAILNVLLFLIIAVAGFGILAIFFMIVVEKTRDIGILKALGAHSSGVMTIFLSYGLGLGMVGAGAGVVLGLLFVWRINDIEALLTRVTGIEVFDDRIYYFPTIPTHVEPGMVAWVAFGAVAIAVMASILPARRAALLHPVQALRYE